jgi:hypothetical protein
VMKSMRLRWVGHVARMGDEKCMQNFGRKTWRKRPLERPRRRWNGNIKNDVRETGWEVVD